MKLVGTLSYISVGVPSNRLRQADGTGLTVVPMAVKSVVEA